MLLVCPNCGAQYEVEAEVIPLEGRDVQCSTCGETWWATREAAPEPEAEAQDQPDPGTDPQHHEAAAEEEQEQAPPAESWFSRARARSEEAEAPEAGDLDATEPEPADLDAPQPAPVAESDNGDFWVRDDGAEPEDIFPGEDADLHPEASPEADAPEPAALSVPRRPLDPQVADVLRQEAQRETDARRAEGANAGDRAMAPAAPAAARSEEDEPAAATDLPDIDEINSTLEGDEDFDEEALLAELIEEERRRMGRMRGFGLMMLLTGLVALSYVFAPAISDAVPALRPMMDSYVAAVNEIRVWLYSAALNASNALQGAGGGN